MKKKGVVLVSGGIDSITVVAMMLKDGYEVFPISFMYGQRHIIELEKAKKSLELLGVKNLKIINLDLRELGGSALTDDSISVPKYNLASDLGNQVPVTYVPARNTIFLSLALAYAEVISAYDIFYGAHSQDAANYPDTKPEFIQAFEQLANKAVDFTSEEHRIKIHAPLIKMTKAEIVKTGLDLAIDYSHTISCYDSTKDGLSCGNCLACLMRKEAFKINNVKDPTKYV